MIEQQLNSMQKSSALVLPILSRAFEIVVLLKKSQEDVAEIALDVAQSAGQQLRRAEDNINKTYTLLLVLQSQLN